MIDRRHPDPARQAELTDQDLVIATLVGRYVECREADQPPCTHHLFAVAAEFGDTAVDAHRTVDADDQTRWRARSLQGREGVLAGMPPAQSPRPAAVR